jgi:hypothetical protein
MDNSERDCSPLCLALCTLLILGTATSPGIAEAQHRLMKRNVMLDSIAWIPQQLPIPGVVAGDAIWFDYNNDCRLDILMAGVDSTGPVSGIYANDSVRGFVNIEANLVPVASERGMAWGDFENDGDYDVAFEGNRTPGTMDPVSRVYRNAGEAFVDMNAPITNMNGGSVAWVDYNNDGRLDLFICGSPDLGGTFRTILYKNVNNQLVEDPVGLPGVWGSSVSWADVDRDGDLDLLISGYGGSTLTRLFRNIPVGDSLQRFEEIRNPVEGMYRFEAVASSASAWFDYDNDGWQDLVLVGGGYRGPVAMIYHNDREGSFHDIGAQLSQVTVGAVAVGDYDNDGFVDLAISGGHDLYLGTNPITKIYHNNGNGTFTDIGANLIGTWWGSLEWGDYDKDGRLDLLVTGGTVPRDNPYTDNTKLKGITMIYRNTVVVDSNETPGVPAGATAVVNGNSVTLSWSSATDSETPTGALSYNLRVGTTPGGIDAMSPLSNPVNGFRRVPKIGNAGMRTSATVRNLKPGTYRWSVQSVDNQLAASKFSPEFVFTIASSSVHTTPDAPSAFVLEQNYPNPFNPSTTIQYALPSRSVVTLTVFNTLGQEVARFVKGEVEAGYHDVKFSGNDLASGIYYYRLQVRPLGSAQGRDSRNGAGDFVATKKMLVVR